MDAIDANPAPKPARKTLVSGSVTAKNATATIMAIVARQRDEARSNFAAPAQAAMSTATLNPLIAST